MVPSMGTMNRGERHGLTARLVAELFRVMQRVQANAASIELPILLLHGGEDSMASPQGSRFLDEHISSVSFFGVFVVD